MHRRGRGPDRLRGLLGALFWVSGTGAAAEIVIENTAIEKTLMQQLFVDAGRYHLVAGTRCQYAYLTAPSIAISRGRISLTSRLTGRLGIEVGGQCSGVSDAFDVTLSGQPYFSGERLGLKDLRIDEVSNPLYKPMLQALLTQALPRAIDINLREGVQKVLAGQGYDVVVNRLSVTDLVSDGNRVRAKLDFAVSAR
ncbi:MAG TPA: hypothetical protein VNM24_15380 [Burkholderiales bacterium]|jgi:hypothetical protein|nr:hypothetical protein [Burkholderiales bacterium]